MKRRTIFLAVLAFLVGASAIEIASGAPAARRPPNIIFILLDDQGWADGNTMIGRDSSRQSGPDEYHAGHGIYSFSGHRADRTSSVTPAQPLVHDRPLLTSMMPEVLLRDE